jgi:hypothetical protein
MLPTEVVLDVVVWLAGCGATAFCAALPAFCSSSLLFVFSVFQCFKAEAFLEHDRDQVAGTDINHR